MKKETAFYNRVIVLRVRLGVTRAKRLHGFDRVSAKNERARVCACVVELPWFVCSMMRVVCMYIMKNDRAIIGNGVNACDRSFVQSTFFHVTNTYSYSIAR